MLSMFRKGEPTPEDIDSINDKCETSTKKPPPGIQIPTYTNKDRDAINSVLFDDMWARSRPADGEKLKNACVIFMDDLCMNDSLKTLVSVKSNSVKRYFYESCSKSACNHGSKGRGRVDPMLKLYSDAPIMLPQNSDVANGEANGS